MPIMTMLETRRPVAGTATPAVGVGRDSRRAGRGRAGSGRRFPPASGCARASACRCGRTCRTACSRPGSTGRACRGPPRGCRRSRSRPAGRRRAAGKRSSHFRVPSLGDLLGDDLRPGQREGAGERGAEVLGDVGHRREVGGAADVDPVPELRDAHAQPGAPARRSRRGPPPARPATARPATASRLRFRQAPGARRPVARSSTFASTHGPADISAPGAKCAAATAVAELIAGDGTAGQPIGSQPPPRPDIPWRSPRGPPTRPDSE